jgi:Pentapeptide repeats (8 copies)
MNQPPEAIAPPPTKPSALVARIRSLSERIVRWGDKSDFVKLLELLGKFGLVIAAATYLFEIPAQRQAREDALKAKRYQAWALINSAQGSSADGGRLEALQDLNGDGIILAGANLTNAYLSSIKLPKADLRRANLGNANLTGADLRAANLSSAYLVSANLFGADLTGTDLSYANLTDARIDQGQLDDACGADAKLPPGLTLKPCSPPSSP